MFQQVTIPGADAPLTLDAATTVALQRSARANLNHAMSEAGAHAHHMADDDPRVLCSLAGWLEEATAAIEQLIALAPPLADTQPGMAAAFDGVGVLHHDCRSAVVPLPPVELVGAERFHEAPHLARVAPHGDQS